MAELSKSLKRIGHEARGHVKTYCTEAISDLQSQLEAPLALDSTNTLRGQIRAYRNLIQHINEIERGPA